MAPTWRLLDLGPLPAADNMALDEVLLTSRGQGRAPDTLRFLRFRPGCALVGYHQVAEDELDLGFCHAHGIEVNRRLTGGGAIYCHESQVGWELALAESQLPHPPGTSELGRWACQGAVLGLERLGLQAHFAGKNDLLLGDKKIGGCGGVSLAGGYLIHGSLLVEQTAATMLRVLRIHPEKLSDKPVSSADERVTCLAAQMSEVPDLATIKRALVAGFAAALGVDLVPQVLSVEENASWHQLLPRYRSAEWVFGLDRSLPRRELCSALKLPGGLVRVSLALAAGGRQIERISINGDFFAHPAAAMRGLETDLRGVDATRYQVEQAVAQWAAASGASIPGVGPDGLVEAILKALPGGGGVTES
ncbi:MAG: lipoate--protein ligase family protein [Anaerolineae bacterium]